MAIIKEMIFKISSVIDNLTSAGLSDGAPERTEISIEGFYKIDGESYEVTYTENTEGGRVVTCVNVDAESVRVVRRGAVDSDMLFKEGESHRSLYTVGAYSFDTEVRCRKIRRALTRDGGRLDLFYDMSIGGADKAVRMRIECSEREGS